MIPRTYTVYRFYNADGDVLYVGCTKDLRQRTSTHRRDKPWWPQVADIQYEEVTGRRAAYARERLLIAELDPRHGGGSRGSKAAADARADYAKAVANGRPNSRPVKISASAHVDRPEDVEWRALARKSATAHAYVNGDGRCPRARLATRNPRRPVADLDTSFVRCEKCARSVEPRDCLDCGSTFVKVRVQGTAPKVCSRCLHRWWDVLILRRVTLQEIADRIGLTRQGVARLVDHHFGDLERAQMACKMLREAAEATARRCLTCGAMVPASGRVSYCDDRCYDLRTTLRRVVNEDDWRVSQQAIARWNLDHVDGDTPDHQVAYWRKTVEGRWDEIDRHGRWLVEGSSVWAAAVEVVGNGWPLADEMHPDIREQVESHLSERSAAA